MVSNAVIRPRSKAYPVERDAAGRNRRLIVRKKIIIVDQDAGFRKAMALYFNLSGHTVAESASGGEAMRKMEETFFDTILCDYFLPDMTAEYALALMRERGPGAEIFVLSSYDQDLFENTFGVFNVTGVIAKPIDPEDIAAFIEQSWRAGGNDPGQRLKRIMTTGAYK